MSSRLPVLLSVPHAGLEVPEQARAYCVLTPELPWVQLELSRAPFLSPAEKRVRVLDALRELCSRPG